MHLNFGCAADGRGEHGQRFLRKRMIAGVATRTSAAPALAAVRTDAIATRSDDSSRRRRQNLGPNARMGGWGSQPGPKHRS